MIARRLMAGRIVALLSEHLHAERDFANLRPIPRRWLAVSSCWVMSNAIPFKGLHDGAADEMKRRSRSPQPSQRISEYRAAVTQIVRAFAEDELVIVAGERKRCCHRLVR